MHDDQGPGSTPPRPDEAAEGGAPQPPRGPGETAEAVSATAVSRPEPPARRKTRLALLGGVLAGLLLIAAGAVAGVLFILRGTGDVLVDNVPSDALVYATAYLDPSADQKLNLASLLRKFPAVEDENVGRWFSEQMDEGLGDLGLGFEEDVKPWLGTQAGVVITSPAGDEPGAAILIATDDPGATEAAMVRVQGSDEFEGKQWSTTEHGGVTIHVASLDFPDLPTSITPSMVYAISDDVLILASDEDAAKAVIDAEDDNLADDENYATTMTSLPEDRLAMAYINMPAIVDVLKDQGLQEAMALSGQPGGMDALDAYRGMAMSVAAERDGMAMRMVANVDTEDLPDTEPVEAHRSAVLDWIPQDTYGFMGSSGLDQGLKELLDTLDDAQPGFRDEADRLGLTDAAEGLTGDFGLTVDPQPDSDIPGGAFLLAVDDPAAVRSFLDRMATFVSQGMADAFAGDPASGLVAPTSASGSLHQSPFSPPSLAWKTESYGGVEIRSLPTPDTAMSGIAIAYAVADDMAIVATSPGEIKQLIDASNGANVTDNANYRAAIAHGDETNTGMMFMDLQSIIAAIADADPSAGDLETDMAPLKAFIMTSGASQETSFIDMFLLIT